MSQKNPQIMRGKCVSFNFVKEKFMEKVMILRTFNRIEYLVYTKKLIVHVFKNVEQ